jgi:hypothetical protein
MTPVPESGPCVSRESLGPTAQLTATDLWPGAIQTSFHAERLVPRGGGTGCDVALPGAPRCDAGFPWVGGRLDDSLLSLGASRLVSGRVSSTVAASAGSSAADRTLTYIVVVPGDKPMDRWLESATVRCAGATRGRIGGAYGLVGTVPGAGGAVPRVPALLARSAGRAVWLRFDGGAWSPDSRASAAGVAVATLAGTAG